MARKTIKALEEAMSLLRDKCNAYWEQGVESQRRMKDAESRLKEVESQLWSERNRYDCLAQSLIGIVKVQAAGYPKADRCPNCNATFETKPS